MPHVVCPECETVLEGTGGVCPKCGSPVGEQQAREVLNQQGKSTGISVVPLLKASPDQPPPTPLEIETRANADNGVGGGFLEMSGDNLELDTERAPPRAAGFVTSHEDEGETGGFLQMDKGHKLELDTASRRPRPPPPPGAMARPVSREGAPVPAAAPMVEPSAPSPFGAGPPLAQPPAQPPAQLAQPAPNPFAAGPLPPAQPAPAATSGPRPLPGAAGGPRPLPGVSGPSPAVPSRPRPPSRSNVQKAPPKELPWTLIAGVSVVVAVGVLIALFAMRGGS